MCSYALTKKIKISQKGSDSGDLPRSCPPPYTGVRSRPKAVGEDRSGAGEAGNRFASCRRSNIGCSYPFFSTLGVTKNDLLGLEMCHVQPLLRREQRAGRDTHAVDDANVVVIVDS